MSDPAIAGGARRARTLAAALVTVAIGIGLAAYTASSPLTTETVPAEAATPIPLDAGDAPVEVGTTMVPVSAVRTQVPVQSPSAAVCDGIVVDARGFPRGGVAVLIGQCDRWDVFADPATITLYGAELTRAAGRDGPFHAGEVTHTDTDGRFEFALSAVTGDAAVVAWSPRHGAAHAVLERSHARGMRLVLPDQCSILGSVTSTQSSPIEGAIVRVYRRGRATPITEATTDATGRYRTVPLAGGALIVHVAAPGFQSPPNAHLTVADGNDGLVQDFVVAALPRVALRLVDDKTVPWTPDRLRQQLDLDADRVKFFLSRRVCESRGALERESDTALELHLQSDGTLTGSLTDADAGQLSAWVGDDRLGGCAVDPRHPGYATLLLRVPIDRIGLEVVVRFDPAPPSLPELAVAVSTWTGPTATELHSLVETRGRQAHFALDLSAADIDDAVLLVTAPGWLRRLVPLHVENGAMHHLEVVTMEPATRSLSGVVVDPQNRPVKNASVVVVDDQPDGPRLIAARQSTDSSGRFTCVGLPGRTVRLLVDAEELAPRSLICDPTREEPVRVDLQHGREITLECRTDGVQLRIYDHRSAIAYDDRLFGAARFGRRLRIRVDSTAQEIEARGLGDGTVMRSPVADYVLLR